MVQNAVVFRNEEISSDRDGVQGYKNEDHKVWATNSGNLIKFGKSSKAWCVLLLRRKGFSTNSRWEFVKEMMVGAAEKVCEITKEPKRHNEASGGMMRVQVL